MRFCSVLRQYPKDAAGGAEYQAYLIGRELADRGHDIHYVAHQADETDSETDDGMTVHRMGQTATRDEKLQKLEEINADYYYFRLAPDLPLLWLAKRRLSGTFIYNISRDVQCQSLFSPGPFNQDNNLIQNVLARPRWGLYRQLLKTPDMVFAQTADQQEMLEANRNIDSTVIGNGHPVPDDEIEKESPPVVLWLSSLKKVKNPLDFAHIAKTYSHLECEFWMVGRPAEKNLQARVRDEANTNETLEYLGGCDIFESNDFFKRASVFVHTGDSEGFPNTLIQSWLHKTPVISLCTNPDAVLSDNNIGVHCHSVSEAGATLEKIIADEQYREEMGERAREYAVTNHGIEMIVDKIEREL